MGKQKVTILMMLLLIIITTVPVHASADLEETKNNEILIVQPNFTNITVFYNDFYINDHGKAVLTSSVDARNVDEIRISTYLQKYQDGKWTTVKNWSKTQSGTFSVLGETWYVSSGYQYRMRSYCYVYVNEALVESSSYTSKSIIY